MPISREDPFPNLPRTSGIARQYGQNAADRMSREPAPARQPASLPQASELERLKAEQILMRKQFELLREDVRALRERVMGPSRGPSDPTDETLGEGGEGTTEGPRLSKKAAQMKRYRERKRAKRDEA